ncbi:MAG: methyltransferase domain-containing protein [Caldilineaceae bacterium]|nr:methyltransferase domain-containing protein [Caldilineaceae bacterium]MCB0127562.1 methyltransferase domain-containing protein [Caldilineaceae bacterium]
MNHSVNFGLTASDYGKHRAGFPPSLFERLAPYGIGEPGQQVVDLGTGTGTLARGFASRGCDVIGIDPAAAMLAEARRLADAAALTIDFRLGKAEATGLPAQSADVVSAGQCWHWFDRPAAAAEVARILRPSGKVVIAHFDWLPLAGNVVAATEALIEQYNPAWKLGGGTGLYPQWLRDLGEAGFCGIETFSYDMDVPYSHEAWRGRIRASAGVGASLAPDEVQRFDAELAALLQAMHPEPAMQIPHRISAVIANPPQR